MTESDFDLWMIRRCADLARQADRLSEKEAKRWERMAKEAMEMAARSALRRDYGGGGNRFYEAKRRPPRAYVSNRVVNVLVHRGALKWGNKAKSFAVPTK